MNFGTVHAAKSTFKKFVVFISFAFALPVVASPFFVVFLGPTRARRGRYDDDALGTFSFHFPRDASQAAELENNCKVA